MVIGPADGSGGRARPARHELLGASLSKLTGRTGAASARDRLRGTVWTAGSLLLVTLVKLAAFDYLGPGTPFLLYFVSIMIAAWYAGWRGGLVATAVSAILGTYFFIAPYHVVQLPDLVGAVRLGAFLFEGAVVTAITTRLRNERARADVAAEEARGSLAKLEGVLRGVADGITVQDARGQLIYANATAAHLTGFPSAEALLSASVPEILARFELLDPAGGPFPPAELPGRLVLQGLPAPERLIRFRVRATGEERWALVRATPVRLDGSETLHAVNVFQDVTRARQQEEALRLSEERYSTTLQSIGDAVIATDAGGQITFLNPLAERLTGWTASAASGRSLPEVFRIFNEETRAPAESPVDRVLREGKVVGLANHTVLVARDGTEVSIDDSAALIRSAQGEIMGTVLVFRDVSDRRVEELRRTFVSRATAELASSLDYRRTLATVARLAVPTIADWCAVDIQEEGELRRLAVEHVDPEKVRLVYEIQRRYPEDPRSPGGAYEVMRAGQPVFVARINEEGLLAVAQDEEHLRLIRQLELRSYIAVPLSANGVSIGVLSLAMAQSGREYGARDLELATALADRAALAVNHARLFADATAARTEAERANRAKDEFLAMLGHELRNPLAPILTALQLMKFRAPNALERERAVLERQVKHLVTLVDDLLDVSRIARGKVDLSREPVDLSDTLAKALELSGPLLEERRHEVVTSVPPGLWVAGDPVRLAQVLSNLLTNAAKYTEAGGRIEVTGTREGDDVVICVRDNGVGIAPELLPRVFDLFIQGSQSLDRAKGGLGLGLAIVRSVTELHGGRVVAESAGSGRGSEFRVIFPALRVLPPAGARTPLPGTTTTSGVKVLVVDDNEDALALLAEALTLFGYEAHTAPDPASALARAAIVRPQVALLDIGLPVMDGYDLALRLQSTPGLEAMKLVAVTGYGQPADKERARAAGFHAHLVKPISVDEVRRVLERLLPVA